MRFLSEILRGLWRENPLFRLLLGMCPTLAVTTSLENALGMGAAVCFVLVCSNVIISLFRNLIPPAVRIPCYIVLIASFVSAADMLMHAYTPDLADNLGIFIPLIAVNCIILGRAEAYAAKNPVLDSLADGLGMGLGYLLALAVIGTLREAVGSGCVTVWGSLKVTLHNGDGLSFALIPAGGFITLGAILAAINAWQHRQARRRGLEPPNPPQFDCRRCVGCFPRKTMNKTGLQD